MMMKTMRIVNVLLKMAFKSALTPHQWQHSIVSQMMGKKARGRIWQTNEGQCNIKFVSYNANLLSIANVKEQRWMMDVRLYQIPCGCLLNKSKNQLCAHVLWAKKHYINMVDMDTDNWGFWGAAASTHEIFFVVSWSEARFWSLICPRVLTFKPSLKTSARNRQAVDVQEGNIQHAFL